VHFLHIVVLFLGVVEGDLVAGGGAGDGDGVEQVVEDVVDFEGVVLGKPSGELVGVLAKVGVDGAAPGFTQGGVNLGVGFGGLYGGNLFVEGKEAAFEGLDAEQAAQVGVFEALALAFEFVDLVGEGGFGRGVGGGVGLHPLEVGADGIDQEMTDAGEQVEMGDGGVGVGFERATPDETVGDGAGAVLVAPERGAALPALEQAGELVVLASAIVAGAAAEFGQKALVGFEIPEGLVEADGLDDLFGGDVTVAGFAVVALVFDDFGNFEADDPGIERIFQDVAHGLGMPNAGAGRGDGLGLQVVDELADGVALEQAVFEFDQVDGQAGIGFGDGFAVVGVAGGFAIAEGELGRQMVEEDAVAHPNAVFAADAGGLDLRTDVR